MDLIPNSLKEKKSKSVKKEIGEYFDFPCKKCGKKKVKLYVYGYIDGPSRLSSREIPGGCIIEEDSPKWHCNNCGLDSGSINY